MTDRTTTPAPESLQRSPAAEARTPPRSAAESAAIEALAAGRCHEPFAWLGRHASDAGVVIRALRPRAVRAWFPGGADLAPIADGVFEWRGMGDVLPKHYRVAFEQDDGSVCEETDPYTFAPECDPADLDAFAGGLHAAAYRFLGAHRHARDAIDGTTFRVWAPNAERVSLVGDFVRWDGRALPMHAHGDRGVFSLFVPGVGDGALYKFEIRARDGRLLLKADPYARRFEAGIERASVVCDPPRHAFDDDAWMTARATRDWRHAPMSIYEVHLGSWRPGRADFRAHAVALADYVRSEGFTHVELLPVAEHPFYGSWGYQATGYFAPTERYGNADDLRFFVDHLHRAGIGVLLDWTPAHFPADAHALAGFDGTALYEHEDPRRGRHPDWDTLIYNYGRHEVRSFLLSSALYWLREFHFDGLRVDAVASMLYLDYSRAPGEWLPNRFGGRENLEAIDLLRALNVAAHGECPGAIVIAEESTAYPLVTRPVEIGGLGFTMKWNMGFMHDTLAYLALDPVFRKFHHDKLTFGMLYAWSENYVLPFSHDEVVHGKRSLLGRMAGDRWQQFANLRLLYTLQYTSPGKKLLFMGCEFAQEREWDHERGLDWACLDDPLHRGVRDLLRALNRAYTTLPPLHALDFDAAGFEWIDCHDSDQSVASFLRFDRDGHCVAVVLNFTPVARHDYRIGVPVAGRFRELLNSDSAAFGGSNVGNLGAVVARNEPWMGRPHSIALTVPPLGALILLPEAAAT